VVQVANSTNADPFSGDANGNLCVPVSNYGKVNLNTVAGHWNDNWWVVGLRASNLLLELFLTMYFS
jgi:hypothetical protein